MRIALISFEYPIDTGWGGIATYVQQAAYMLKESGYDVEVFCGTQKESYQYDDNGVKIHLVKTPKRLQFHKSLLPIFTKEHQLKPFDVLEVPEYATDAKSIMEQFAEVAVVVKTHSPMFFNNELNTSEWSNWYKFKHLYRVIRYGHSNALPSFYNYKNDPEYLVAKKADIISSPSKSLEQKVRNTWMDLDVPFQQVHYPFSVDEKFSSIEIREKKEVKHIAFIGRLEIRKGILDLAKAIPSILEKYPTLQFHFIGRAQTSPNGVSTMDEYIKNKYLSKYLQNCHFYGVQTKAELITHFEMIDVCIFPSIWENFPNVCLESMSAGKVVIGSKEGGMSEMIDDKINGLLIEPKSESQIINAVEYIVENPQFLYTMGKAAREKIKHSYSYESILPKQIALYQKAIDLRKLK